MSGADLPRSGADRLQALAKRTASARNLLVDGAIKPELQDSVLLDSVFADEASWDFSLPTMIPRNAKFASGLNRDLVKQSDMLWERAPIAGEEFGVDLEALFRAIFDAGFVVAGGAVCNLLRGQGISSDLDLFAPGLAPEEAERRLFEVAARLEADDLVIDRTLNCITLLWARCEVQLITRTYASVSEILYSFDLAPSAVAWNGYRVFYTPEAAYAHATGVFVPDVSKRRRSFEDRIKKYHQSKLFSVVLPRFVCEDALDRWSVVKMPYLNIALSAPPEGNKYKTYYINPRRNGIEREAEELQEQRRVYGALPYFDREAIIQHNVWRLLTGDNYLVWTFNRETENWEVGVPDDTEEVIEVLKWHIAPAHRGSTRLYVNKMGIVFNGEALAMGEVMKFHAASRNKDLEFPVTGKIALQNVATRVQFRARELRNYKFLWKTAEQGTDLHHAAHDAPVAMDHPGDEPIFKMEPVALADWYGEEHFKPEKQE